MRAFVVFFFVCVLPGLARACEVCLAQQPKFTRGWTHGAGPQGDFDYVIVFVALLIVVFTLAYAIKYLVHPGEREPDHIKRTILNQSYEGVQGNR